MRLRRALAAGLVVATGAVALASAASLAMTSASLGAGRATTPRCGTTGLGVIQNLSAGTVVSVTVSSLPAGCAGATIQVAVNNGTTSATGSSTVPAGGGSLTITLSAAPAVALAESTDIVLLGP